MKNYFLIISCMMVNYFSYSQENQKSYTVLFKQADSLYRSKDYRNAAINFSAILKLSDRKPTIWDWNNAAFSWSKAGFPDSALYYLEMIAEIDSISFSDYLDISTDQDYTALHDINRWKVTIARIFNNARKALPSQILLSNEETAFRLQFFAAQAWVNNNEPDSAFTHLKKLATSKALTMKNADEILKNITFKELYPSNEWKEFIDEMFLTLNKKYIPANTLKKKNQKRVLIDGAHYNFHDITGTYEVLAGVLRKSRFNISGITEAVKESNLKNIDILLISNPSPDRMDSLNKRAQRDKEPTRWSKVATQSAFTPSEVLAIKNWVYNGGSLLLILDHAPYGKSGGLLAEAFGVESRNVSTLDSLSLDPAADTVGGARNILFTRSKGLIGSHPIMNGVDSVTTYTGESLLGPKNSFVLLQLASTAYDRDWLPETRQYRNRTALGRSQGIALEFGKGRLVLLGEAAQTRPAFLSVSNRGNWPFLLNILRWLAKEEFK
ncbi:MAG: hypothetical protein ABIR30_05160 [Chitinophagaceae bacterium]